VPHSPFVEQYSSGVGKFAAVVHVIAIDLIFLGLWLLRKGRAYE
jgi:hypothetical protein